MINSKAYTCEELGITAAALTGLPDLRFYNVREIPEMRIYGVMDAEDGHAFVRMPEERAKAVSESVYCLNYNTAGGRLRFVTDSPYVALRTTVGSQGVRHNFSALGAAGFDLYVKVNGRQRFFGRFPSPITAPNGFDGIVSLPEGTNEVTVNFPNYSKTSDLYVGLEQGSTLTRHPDYTFEKPAIFCGSSITQGGCASRAGMSYENIISRRCDLNYTNLGFAGSFLGQKEMADYIATLDPSVLVLDYDHNAPNPEHLKNTHESLYLTFRNAHPDTPVVFVGRPNYYIRNRVDSERRDVIFTTYNNARQRGEKVMFVDGYSLFGGDMRDDCTVDGTHPNDLGMSRMADVIGRAVMYALSM